MSPVERTGATWRKKPEKVRGNYNIGCYSKDMTPWDHLVSADKERAGSDDDRREKRKAGPPTKKAPPPKKRKK